MEFEYHYEGLVERQIKVAEAEAEGLRLLHDNFDDPAWKPGDEFIGTLIYTDEPEPIPEPPPPPLCTHWAKVDSLDLTKQKPITVKRTWHGREYQVDCYVTENIKDQYQAGNIAIGDYVIVEFLDDDAAKAVVTAKVLISP